MSTSSKRASKIISPQKVPKPAQLYITISEAFAVHPGDRTVLCSRVTWIMDILV